MTVWKQGVLFPLRLPRALVYNAARCKSFPGAGPLIFMTLKPHDSVKEVETQPGLSRAQKAELESRRWGFELVWIHFARTTCLPAPPASYFPSALALAKKPEDFN